MKGFASHENRQQSQGKQEVGRPLSSQRGAQGRRHTCPWISKLLLYRVPPAPPELGDDGPAEALPVLGAEGVAWGLGWLSRALPATGAV